MQPMNKVRTRVVKQALILSEKEHQGSRYLLDRPFIRHLAEFLVHHEIGTIDFMGDFSDYDSQGNGDHEDLILLGRSDLIPPSSVFDQTGTEDPSTPALFYSTESSGTAWTGWAMLPRKLLRRVIGFDLEQHDHTRITLDDTDQILSFRSNKGILQAHRRMLGKELPGLHLPGRQIKEGIWTSGPVKIHSSAHLTPPVWIGADTRIELGAQIGPFASIGAGCLIRRHSLVEDSVILPGTLVGENLELNGVIVDRGRLINTRLDTETIVTDPFILCSTADLEPRKRLTRTFRRLSSAIKRNFTSRRK